MKLDLGDENNLLLSKAIDNCSLKDVIKIVSNGVNINGPYYYPGTALRKACISAQFVDDSKYSEYKKIVKFLIENGADPNIESETFGTPLQLLINGFINYYGSIERYELILYMIYHGADPTVTTYSGERLLDLLPIITEPYYRYRLKNISSKVIKYRSIFRKLFHDINLTLWLNDVKELFRVCTDNFELEAIKLLEREEVFDKDNYYYGVGLYNKN
jgi:hypothetical protein